ncbi:MAG: hypothetical protein ACR2PR_03300 [Pseudohongiellaceae bacterium]
MSWIERVFWLMLLIAPWFYMMARLKNMGYTRKDVRRYFDDFGYCVGTLTIMALLVGVISDVLFNWIFGTIIFREFPREFLFTSRVKRHAEKRTQLGHIWKERLNKIMPGHV